MAGTFFGAASPVSLRRAVVVTEQGLDELYQLGGRRHHAWGEVGAVRWAEHGRAVVCCDRRDVDLAGLADVAGAVAAIEQRIAWQTTPARLSAEANQLGRKWYEEDVEWRRVGVPGVVLLTGLILGRLMVPLLVVAGLRPAIALLVWSGIVLVGAGLAGLFAKQDAAAPVPLVSARGIRPADGGPDVAWSNIMYWRVVDDGAGQPARLDLQTRLGTVPSLAMSVERADQLSSLLQRRLGECAGPSRTAGPEPVADTALSLVRMTDEPAGGRGLSLSRDDRAER